MSEIKNKLFQFKEQFRDVKPESFTLVTEVIAELSRLEEEVRLKTLDIGVLVYRLKVLTEGLKFYADEATWARLPPQTLAAVVKGQRAKDALRTAGLENNE
jgi:hypothetical protein